MPPALTCPACGQSFPAPAAAGPHLTCPCCQARLPQEGVRPAEQGIRPGAPTALPLATLPCPHCGQVVPALCRLCPHCEEPLGGNGERTAGIGSGSPPMNPVEVALAGLGLSVVLAVSLGALVNILHGGEARAGGLAVLFVLGVVGGAITLVAWDAGKDRGRGIRRRLITRMLAGVGCLILGGVALLIFAGVVCVATF